MRACGGFSAESELRGRRAQFVHTEARMTPGGLAGQRRFRWQPAIPCMTHKCAAIGYITAHTGTWPLAMAI